MSCVTVHLSGHELVQSFPREALSWYAVGCYYYTLFNSQGGRGAGSAGSGKLDLAHKYLTKATKLDKRYLHYCTADIIVQCGYCVSALTWRVGL